MAIVQSNSYEVFIDEPYSKLNAAVEELNPSSIFVIVDENTERDCLPRFKEVFHQDFLSLRIPSGEKYKNINVCQNLWDALIKNRCDRKSLIINLGGGVIGDMGGFIAGTYMRGISFIQVPTTLLSQVDASIGGKLGIDFKAYKNMIGLFLDPLLVWIDHRFLETLPEKELKSGYAEIIKHALIRSQALWQTIQTKGIELQGADWTKLLIANVEIKNFVVKQDRKESGLRKVLNFGHSIGHAIESTFLNSDHALTHGHSIAIGMICESYISFKTELLSETELATISTFILNLYEKEIRLKENAFEILEKVNYDKKNASGKKLFALVNGIGKSVFDIEVSDELILESIDFYHSQITHS